MVQLLLILLYTICSIFLLIKLSRNYRNQLSARQVTISFIIKVLFGMAYGFIFLKFYNGDDTWKYFQSSVDEYNTLLHHPLQFFQDIGSKASGKLGLDAVYDTKNSFWNNIDEVLFIKLLAVFNVFSFGHYYVNVVLFCFVAYFGNLFLFQLLVRYFPKSSPLLIVVIFYAPVIVFWLSGIRKDGLLFLALSVVLFYFDRLMRKENNAFWNFAFFLSGLVALWFIRNFMVMCLVPALLAWLLCQRFKLNVMITFSGVYILGIFFFFISGSLPGLPDLAQKVVNRQQDFFSLTANTRLSLDSLKASPSSYLHVLPQAANHSFLRPFITESKSILQVISALDVFVFFAALALAIIFQKRHVLTVLQNPLLLTCIFTACFGYLLIGYTVPFPGAIVRYKVIFELLFLSVFAVLTDRDKLLKVNIKNKIHT